MLSLKGIGNKCSPLHIASLVILLSVNLTSCNSGNDDQGMNTQGSMSYTIKESATSISYDVGGVVDESSFLWPSLPPNERFVSSIMIKNRGDNVVVNPRISINGFRIPLTTAELLSAITLDSQDSLDRLLKIFYAVDRYSVHEDMRYEQWQESPLTFFVGYGGGICEDRANIQRMLWDVLGHRSRNSQANGHTVYDVEYGSRIFHLDTDTESYYLMHDNSTGASSTDILDDPMLVQRAVHYRNYLKYPITAKDPEPDMWPSSEKVAALYEDGFREPLFVREPVHEEFKILLKPGEGYGWNSDKPKHLHPIFHGSDLSNVVRDLIWETRLDFSKASHRWAVQKTGDAGSSVRDSAVTIDKSTKIVLSYGYPFPVTGIDLTLHPGANVSPNTIIRLTIQGGKEEPAHFDIPLNELLSSNEILGSYIQKLDYLIHNLEIEISLPSVSLNGNNVVPLDGLLFRIYSQGTAYAFRSFKTGRNELVYTDASEQRSVEVQVSAIPLQTTLPGFPAGALFSPGGNHLVAENELAFSWPKSVGAEAKGYQIQIAGFADMRYPLSPTFERMIDKNDVTESQGIIQYRLPWRGMLPVNRNLYWRVRPFRDDLLVGQWSSIFPFMVKGPQSPERINLEYNQGRVILSWSPSPSGTQPLYYEIHTSSLEGFVPVSEPHRLLGFGNSAQAKYAWQDVTATDWPVVPETTLTTTKETRIILYDGDRENAAWFSKLGAHFRVIAVDSDGSRSCPSPQAHLPLPLIALQDTMESAAGNIAFQVPVISTVGRITTRSPYFLGLWNRPILKYSLSAPSEKWSVDANLGVVRGYLNEREEVSLTVTVEDQFDRKASRQIKIRAR